MPPCDGTRTAPASIPAANNTTQTTLHPRSATLLAPASSAVVLADARPASLLALASLAVMLATLTKRPSVLMLMSIDELVADLGMQN